ncbi:MAG: hypothetical protein JOZ77_05110 [Candidatus Eremiobacteraeota bacterium]|nr:hypothetical protein [Candidatus Eremiobacteraeota bacterium]
MGKLPPIAMLLMTAALAFGTMSPLRGVSAPMVAVNRCNSQTIDEASAHVREYDRRGPGGSPNALLTRYAAIAELLSTLAEERGILTSVCSDAQSAPLFAQIAATAAWALSLEADIAAQLNASCPAAAKALPTMMLADAWLSLASVINDGGGTVPVAFGDVIPKVQTRAQALDLTLPPWSQTSPYWRDQVNAKAKAAVATCPSPSPSASPKARLLQIVRK